jgi:hypothetical protein
MVAIEALSARNGANQRNFKFRRAGEPGSGKERDDLRPDTVFAKHGAGNADGQPEPAGPVLPGLM